MRNAMVSIIDTRAHMMNKLECEATKQVQETRETGPAFRNDQ